MAASQPAAAWDSQTPRPLVNANANATVPVRVTVRVIDGRRCPRGPGSGVDCSGLPALAQIASAVSTAHRVRAAQVEG